MRGWLGACIFASCLAVTAGCGDDPAAPANMAQIIVWAHDGPTDYSGILAEVLETSLADTTRADGKAIFVVAPGVYTVRVHNSSSQLPQYFDHHVDVRSGEQPVVDADYCWTCLVYPNDSPSR